MKKSLSAPPGGVKTKQRILKQRASARPALGRSRRRSKPAALATERTVRCFMDGIDWQHHLGADTSGTELFPDEKTLREAKPCLSDGCGVVEVEVRLVRWVEPQNLKFHLATDLKD